MIQWVEQIYRNRTVGRLYGESDATTNEQLLASVKDLWIAFLSIQLPRYDSNRWNSAVACVQVSHGMIDLSPTSDFDLTKQLLGCSVYLRHFHGRYEEITSDSESEAMYNDMERSWVGALLPAFELARSDKSACSILQIRPIPFRVFTEPDGPPVFTVSLGHDELYDHKPE